MACFKAPEWARHNLGRTSESRTSTMAHLNVSLAPAFARALQKMGWLVALLAGWIGTNCSVARAEPFSLTAVTFNVLVEISNPEGVPPWRERRELCVEMLQDTEADLIGLQEPTPNQVRFLLDALPAYKAIYYDEKAPGYTDATLFYRQATFGLLESGHWWLSPTPDRISIGFGNTLPRIVVWAKLKHISSNRELLVFNTHFDNSMPSQVRMAELCERMLEPFYEQRLPMFFLGDFNTDQKRGDYARLTSNGWHDSYRVSEHASPEGRDDNIATMVGSQIRIDHIFYRGEHITPVAWQRLASPDPDRLLSDHYPVLAKFTIE